MAAFPVAPRRTHLITQHGQTRTDDYFWMRYRDDPAVLEYLQAENDYLAESLQHTQPLQATLFAELKGRLKEDDESVPERRGDYFYYTRHVAGQQYPLYCRRGQAPGAPEELLLDQNALAEGRTFCRLGALRVSPDGQKLAYSLDLDGSEQCMVYLKDLATGALYPETIANTFGSVYSHDGLEWGNDNATLFYLTRDAALRPFQLYRHVLGTDTAKDVLLYEEADDTYYLFLHKSRSGAFLLIQSHATLTSEWRVLPADKPRSAPRLFQARRPGIEYDVEHHGQRFFIVTNEQAQNFKLMETPVDATGCEHWREVVPHRPDVLLEEVAAFAEHLVLFERRGGLKQVRLSAVDGMSAVRYVAFPEPVYGLTPTANPEADTHVVRFEYSSLMTPQSVIDYHMDTGVWELRKQTEIPSGHDPAAYVTERLHATAPDGTQVPISYVHRKGLALDGSAPCLLYGYGSYEISIDPGFSSLRLSLLDRGVVFAIAHVRGGGEMGRPWYDDGKLLRKQNTFTDFIAAAEHLVAAGYTSPERLAARGGSAGGLLMGAVANLRPDLFAAIVAEVPFVDCLTTILDESLPLTITEWEEWGNPVEDPEVYAYMKGYSPYDNVTPQAYPAVLATAGLNDPRVSYWEPAKWVQALRASTTSDRPVLLKTEMGAGHQGPSGRYDSWKDEAFVYAFLLDALGVSPRPTT